MSNRAQAIAERITRELRDAKIANPNLTDLEINEVLLRLHVLVAEIFMPPDDEDELWPQDAGRA